jgi:predicted nuclease with TOPRIM domain
MMSPPIWQVATFFTLFAVIISIGLQVISKNAHAVDSRKVSELVERNEFLVFQIHKLQEEIKSLNADLVQLTLENKTLNEEVGLLTKRVSHLQSQVECRDS